MSTTATIPDTGGQRTARAMLVRAFIAQNCAIGLAYGGFGVSILPLQERFDASRGATSLGISLVILATGVAGLGVAGLSRRFGLRAIMMVGAVLCALGYAVLSVAPSLTVGLLAFGLLVGPGVGLSGTLSATILASGWFPGGRGKAIGLATMPLLMAVVPLAGAALIQRWGLPGFYLVLCAAHLATLPVIAGVREAPRARPVESPHLDELAMTLRGLLSRPLFWTTLLGGGLLNAIGIIGSSHLVSVVIERGQSPLLAATLASVMGASSMAGAVIIGWLCDRLGGAWALTMVAVGFAASWATIGLARELAIMLPAIVVIGLVGPGVYSGVSLLNTRAFGLATMPRAMALFGMFSVPITFVLPPLAGWVHDIVGSYAPVMVAITVTGLSVAVLFVAIALGLSGAAERRAGRMMRREGPG